MYICIASSLVAVQLLLLRNDSIHNDNDNHNNIVIITHNN